MATLLAPKRAVDFNPFAAAWAAAAAAQPARSAASVAIEEDGR